MVPLEPLAQLGQVAGAGELEGRQLTSVAAQRAGQLLAGAGPVGAARLGGEDLVDEAGHGDDVPLQPLRTVHGEDLHPLRGNLDLAGLQPVLLVLGRVEEREERAQRGAGRITCLADELRGLVEEAIQMHPADRDPIWSGEHLDIDTGHPLDLGDEFGQRPATPGVAAAAVRAESAFIRR